MAQFSVPGSGFNFIIYELLGPRGRRNLVIYELQGPKERRNLIKYY